MSPILQLRNGFSQAAWERPLRMAACVVLSAAAAFSLARTSDKTAQTFQVFDFGAYYRAAGAVARGETPYAIDEHGPTAAFVYAPAYAFFLYPLSYLDYTWACRLWMLGNWIVCLVCIFLAMRLVTAMKFTQNWTLLWLATLPMASYFWNNISAGQIGALMVALCLAWAICQRRGRSFLGGIFLALATALKLAPALLVPYVIVRRDWRGLAGFLVGGLALVVAPAPWTGLNGAIELHLEWARHCHNTQIGAQTCRIENQSMLGMLARLPAIDYRDLQQVYPLILLVLAGAGYVWIIWCRRGTRTPEEERSQDNLHLALLFILMTLAHPRAWTCNFVALTPACFLLADRVCRRQPGWKISLAALFLVAGSCASWKSVAGDFSWTGWIHQGKDFWTAVAVAGACCWCWRAGGVRPRFIAPHQCLSLEADVPSSPYSSARMA